jgi:hypothetical protein
MPRANTYQEHSERMARKILLLILNKNDPSDKIRVSVSLCFLHSNKVSLPIKGENLLG